MMQNVPGLKYTLDAGNFYCVGEDVLSAYSALKDYMSNMHIKDWVIDKFGYCVRPELPALNGCTIGKGILPFRELMTELKNDGFDGECIMEINTIEITKNDVEESVQFMKQYL